MTRITKNPFKLLINIKKIMANVHFTIKLEKKWIQSIKNQIFFQFNNNSNNNNNLKNVKSVKIRINARKKIMPKIRNNHNNYKYRIILVVIVIKK